MLLLACLVHHLLGRRSLGVTKWNRCSQQHWTERFAKKWTTQQSIPRASMHHPQPNQRQIVAFTSMGQFTATEVDFEARNWKDARYTFQYQRGHKDKMAMEDFLSWQGTPQQAKASAIEASKNAGRQYTPGVGNVLTKIEAFMQVGDVAMKTAPESVGLVWMGVRLCLHSFEDDFATFNLYSGAASKIIGILISCHVYGRMYGGHGGQKGLQELQELHQRVVNVISGIYCDIMEFSYQMSKQISRNMGIQILKGLLSSASDKFRGMIDRIRASEKTMSEFANKATDQLSIYYAEVSLHKQDVGVGTQKSMKADLVLIKETLLSNLRIQELFANQVKQLEKEKKNMKLKTPLDKAKEKFDENAKRLNPTKLSDTAFEKSKDRQEQGRCQRIFDLEEYRTWRTADENDIMWISGVGGMGRSSK